MIFVVVDQLSKYAHFMPLTAHYISHFVALVFLEHVVKLHGVPRTIVSDRDKVFTGAFWKHLARLQGTQLRMSSAYHPQTDGQTEAVNKSLEMYLRCFVSDHPRRWLDHLAWAEYWYNTSHHSAIGMTPFQAVYGRLPPPLLRHSSTEDTPPGLHQLMIERDAVLADLKHHLTHTQARMKHFADAKRREVQYEVGEFVFVKLQPYRQHSVQLRRFQKHAMRYFGPFKILAKIGSVAYHLDLHATTRIHSVFHVSLLNKCHGDCTAETIPLPLLTMPEGPIIQPVEVEAVRWAPLGDQLVAQALIRWDGVTPASWEYVDELAQLYPSFDLVGKVNFMGGGSVMVPEDPSVHEARVEGSSDISPEETNHPVQVGLRKSKRIKRPTWKLRALDGEV